MSDKPFDLEVSASSETTEIKVSASMYLRLSEWHLVQLILSAKDEHVFSALAEVCSSNETVSEKLRTFLNEE